MAYNGLTNLGSAYLAKCMANKTGVTFTKIKVGNGSIPGEKTGQTTTDLYGFKKEVEILAKEQVDTAIKLTLLLNNLDVVAGFYVKEMGIYIQDGDEEKLYWYINKDNPSYLPDKNTPSNHRYNLYLEVTPVETTVVNFTGQDLLADKKYVDDSIKNFQTENNAVIENLRNTINTKLTKGNLPAGIPDAKAFYDLIEKGYGAELDENLFYLNDAGTKQVGCLYFDRNKKGLFKCIKQTTGTVNSTEFFVDASPNANSDRLANLGINNNSVIEIGKIKFYNLNLISVSNSNYKYNHTIKVPNNEIIIKNSLFTTAFGPNHAPSGLYQGGIVVTELTKDYISLRVTNATNGSTIENATVFYGFITVKN